MLTQFAAGAGYIFKGLRLLTKPGVRRHVIVPLLINIVLFSLAIFFGLSQFGALLDWLLPSWLPSWLLDILRWVLWPLFAVAALVIVFYTFTLVANLIAAPFNSLLSEKLEAQLGGEPVPASKGAAALAAGAMSAVAGELRKLAYLALWAIPLLILFLIPGLNLLAPFLWLAFGSWMLAIEYTDYPMGNRELNFTAVRQRLRRDKPLALGFGAAAMVMTMVPVVNFVAMPTAVAGATMMWVERLKKL